MHLMIDYVVGVFLIASRLWLRRCSGAHRDGKRFIVPTQLGSETLGGIFHAIARRRIVGCT